MIRLTQVQKPYLLVKCKATRFVCSVCACGPCSLSANQQHAVSNTTASCATHSCFLPGLQLTDFSGLTTPPASCLVCGRWLSCISVLLQRQQWLNDRQVLLVFASAPSHGHIADSGSLSFRRVGIHGQQLKSPYGKQPKRHQLMLHTYGLKAGVAYRAAGIYIETLCITQTAVVLNDRLVSVS